jgi:TRAP-type C4-dicarboxylate transport system permease small subunit
MMALEKLARWAHRTVDWLAIGLFIVMCALVLAQVVARKFLDPLVWSEELARYIFSWVCFLGWIIASRNNSHIAGDFFLNRMSVKARAYMHLLCECGTLFFGWLLLRYGLRLVSNNWDVDTVTLFFTYGVVYSMVPVAAVMMIAIALTHIVNLIRIVSARAMS